MDVACEEFLRQNGLEAYIDVLRDNGIKYDNLAIFSANERAVSELFPLLLDRVRFECAVQTTFRQVESDTSSLVSEQSSLASTCGSSVQVLTLNRYRELTDTSELPVELPIAQNVVECNVIKNIIQRSVDGLMVLAFYNQKKNLDQNYRIKLARIVIHSEFNVDPETNISAHRFIYLANSLHKEFPEPIGVKSGPEIWYNPSKTQDKSTSVPSGKLYDQYTVLTKELRRLGLRDTRRGVKRRVEESPEVVQEHILGNIPLCTFNDDELAVRLDYLKSELHDWDTITQYWKDTFRCRYESLTTGGEELLSEYYNKFPALKQPQGFKLLEQDFQTLFPDAYARIYTHWDAFVEKVKRHLNFENIKVPAKCSDAEILHLFSRLFTPVPIKVPKGKAWKPSRKDILDGFLCHLKIDDLEAFWAYVDDRNQARGLKLQPFPMVIGPSLHSIHTCYCIIDKKPLILNSTKEVFAAAFYAYHALNSCYPIQSARLWVVVEKALFGMDNVTVFQSQTLSQVPEVKRLIAYLKV